MNVAIVIQKLAGLRGGAERVVIELANALSERGHKVTVLTFEPSSGAPGYALETAVVNLFPSLLRRLDRRESVAELSGNVEGAVARTGNGAIGARLKWQATHGLFARLLRRWMNTHPVDVAVGFLPPAISAVYFAGATMGSSRPRLVASTHNLPEVDFGDSNRWDQNPVARRRNLEALENVDATTVLQNEFVSQLPELARSRAVVMPNPAAPVNDALLPLGEREPVVLGVGRLTDVKRFDILVAAFAALADEFPDWTLEIYGDGPLKQSLESQIATVGLSSRARLAGVTDEIGAQYGRARVLGHPAAYEGFGLSVSEAILYEVPVVAYRSCPGVNDLVEPKASGVLVDDGTEAFASGLRAMIEAPPSAADRAGAAERLATRLAAQTIYDRWEAILAGDPFDSPEID